MKRLLLSIVALVLFSAFGAGVTWWVRGGPDRSVACAEDDLKKGQVCLETVTSWGEDQVLWIDARPREKWEENGVPGSLLFNDQKEESWDDLDGIFMERQATAPRPHVVVYCNTEGCGSSDIVAKHLREDFGEMLGFKVWVLYGGWKALAAAEMTQ